MKDKDNVVDIDKKYSEAVAFMRMEDFMSLFGMLMIVAGMLMIVAGLLLLGYHICVWFF
jgi:hypothetical protein